MRAFERLSDGAAKAVVGVLSERTLEQSVGKLQTLDGQSRTPRSRLVAFNRRQTNHVFGVNTTLPPLCAAFVIASLTWSKP